MCEGLNGLNLKKFSECTSIVVSGISDTSFLTKCSDVFAFGCFLKAPYQYIFVAEFGEFQIPDFVFKVKA